MDRHLKFAWLKAALSASLLWTLVLSDVAPRSFTIDLDNNTFLKDGKPYQYISGSFHYFRVPSYYWSDRLMKMYAAGLDAVQTYVGWNLHEPEPGVYDFTGDRDLPKFLTEAQNAGLDVILRAGPYICAEFDYGGLPPWLLSDNVSMTVRKMDTKYIHAVERWMGVLLPTIKPFLYSNGGPIIMVQVENEYGSYRAVACDHDYMAYLRDLFKSHLGSDAVLFTTDGNGMVMLECGAIDGVYATVDFGVTGDIPGAFAPMRQVNPKGPLVNSEFYTGWLDYWGGGHAHGETSSIISTMTAIRNYKASVNMYMFEGGTNFGFTNGADPTYSICPTSYDYDAPLSEAGDITPKYLAIRNYTLQFKTLPPVPPDVPKFAYGSVTMFRVGSVLDLLSVVGSSQPSLSSIYPLNMEQANFYHGFVLYRHVLTKSYGSSVLSAGGIRDRGYVLLDGVAIGLLNRNGATSFNMFALNGQTLDIIVENQGRINYGPSINDNKKGLISNVTIGGDILTGWTMYSLNFTQLFSSSSDLHFTKGMIRQCQLPFEPTVYRGTFTVPASLSAPQDTYLKMCGWYKGQVYINGFNVGRYWPTVGPQVTLYVPAGVLHPAPKQNIVLLVELEHSPSTLQAKDVNNFRRQPLDETDVIEFVDQPIINSYCFTRSDVKTLPNQIHQFSRNRL